MTKLPSLRPYEDSKLPDELYCYMYKQMSWSRLYNLCRTALRKYFNEFCIIFNMKAYIFQETMRCKTYRKRRKGRKNT